MDHISIQLGQNQNIYFTSDLHLGHRNVIKFCDRPFRDVYEMDQTLIKNWNETVSQNDYIFNLGDLAFFKNQPDNKALIEKLNGKKYFILGNHCSRKQFDLCKDQLNLLSDICTLWVFIDKNDQRFPNKKFYEIILCHYPLLCYSHSQNGTYNFFGHIHSRKNQPMIEFNKPLQFPHMRYMDVGTDRHDYKPVSLQQILNEIKNYPYWDMHGII